MHNSFFVLILLAFLTGFLFNGCQTINDPFGKDSFASFNAAQDEAIVVLNDEYANFAAATKDSIDGDVLFSINWRNMFYPIDSVEVLRSHLFAVAPNQSTTLSAPQHWGYDMGTVSLNYQDGTIDLNKIETRNSGVVYELGRRRPGGPGGHRGPKGHDGRGRGGMNPGGPIPDTTTIPFYPGTMYEFSNTGSDTIPAISVQATAPNELIDITSHIKGDSIDSTIDLNVNWSGGEVSQPIIISLKPGFKRGGPGGRNGQRGGHGGGQNGNGHSGHRGGPKGGQGGPANNGFGQVADPEDSFGGPNLRHHMFDEYALRYVISANNGTYTIPAADIQELLANTSATALALEVKQLATYETVQNNMTYLFQFRIGDMVPLLVK